MDLLVVLRMRYSTSLSPSLLRQSVLAIAIVPKNLSTTTFKTGEVRLMHHAETPIMNTSLKLHAFLCTLRVIAQSAWNADDLVIDYVTI